MGLLAIIAKHNNWVMRIKNPSLFISEGMGRLVFVE